MSKIDEIKRRVNSTDPDKPIIMAWERDDFNYLLAEVERMTNTLESHAPEGHNVTNQQYVDCLLEVKRYKAVVEAAKELIKRERNNTLSYGCPAVSVLRTDDLHALKAALTELEAEEMREEVDV